MVNRPKSRASKAPVEIEKPKIRKKRCALERCKNLFEPKRKWQKFCCKEHTDEFHLKTETYGRIHSEVEGLIRKEIRQVWLDLETNPPPALVSRLAMNIVKSDAFQQAVWTCMDMKGE